MENRRSRAKERRYFLQIGKVSLSMKLHLFWSVDGISIDMCLYAILLPILYIGGTKSINSSEKLFWFMTLIVALCEAFLFPIVATAIMFIVEETRSEKDKSARREKFVSVGSRKKATKFYTVFLRKKVLLKMWIIILLFLD